MSEFPDRLLPFVAGLFVGAFVFKAMLEVRSVPYEVSNGRWVREYITPVTPTYQREKP